ncbi:MAG: phospholipid/cholesterol/gamma-HCH transport system substrate-binding protein, partial [Solirubrobacteraceae bacterium]|nr:phospholipid/cholesterol/gamma-HCH transport system substrate-binding protein [Solirubrobacteraceae bacterium]
DALAPAMEQVAPGLRALRGIQPGDLTNTVQSGSRLMGELARSEVQLGGFVDSGAMTLGVTAARRADLSQMLDDAPATLDQTRATMVRLRTTFDRLDPLVDGLRPGARRLTATSRAVRPALHELRPVLRQARPLLHELRPALSRLGAAGRAGVPLLQNLDPTLRRLDDSIIPGLEKKGLSGLKLYEAIGPVVASVDSSAALFDANGHTQRFQAANGGARSLGVLPCSPDLMTQQVKCEDLQTVIGTVLGLVGPPPRSTPSSRP